MAWRSQSVRLGAFLLSIALLAGCNSQSSTSTVTTPPALNPLPQATTAPGTPSVLGQPTTANPDHGTGRVAGATAQPGASRRGDGVTAATVNGEAIPLADYQREVAQARNFLLNEQKVNPATPEGDQALKTVYNQVLEGLISEVIIRQYAQKNGITITEDEVKKSVDQLVKDMGSQAEFDKALAARGLTQETFTQTQRAQLIGNKVRDAVTANVPQTAEQVRARHILVQTVDEAVRAARRIEGGESFDKVAKEVSKDPGTAKAGGDLGWFPRGLMVPEFEQQAFSLALNQVSSPVQTQFGYHILQVLEKDPNRKLPEDRWQELRQAKFQDWLEDQRNAAKIERLVE